MMWASAFYRIDLGVGEFFTTFAMLGDYFGNIQHFVLPINDLSFICSGGLRGALWDWSIYLALSAG